MNKKQQRNAERAEENDPICIKTKRNIWSHREARQNIDVACEMNNFRGTSLLPSPLTE